MGWTGNPQIPFAKSIPDYIFRWMGLKFIGPEYAVTEAGAPPVLRPTEENPQESLPFAAAVTSDARFLRRMRWHDPQRQFYIG